MKKNPAYLVTNETVEYNYEYMTENIIKRTEKEFTGHDRLVKLIKFFDKIASSRAKIYCTDFKDCNSLRSTLASLLYTINIKNNIEVYAKYNNVFIEKIGIKSRGV